MTVSQTSRRSNVASFIAMDVMRTANALEARGESILHLEVGQPGEPAPRAARDAAERALASETLGYTDALGRPSLRQRIARHYGETYGLEVDPARVIVTTGSSGAFTLAFLALFDAGDGVGITDPGYPAYRNILAALGLEPRSMPVGGATRWQLNADIVRAAHRERPLRGVLVASPANPTGTMLTPEALADLVGACREDGIAFISDEIYHGLTYGVPQASALETSDDVIVINSFSKYFCMTGWRIGWMVVPERLERVMERLAQNLFISPPTLSQVAAEAALDARADLDAIRDGYAANRDRLIAGLSEIGLDRFAPADGAFYLYADISRFSNDSAEFATRMLHEIGVAATPGLDFDPEEGSSYLRFSYAGTADVIDQAVDRIAGWLKR